MAQKIHGTSGFRTVIPAYAGMTDFRFNGLIGLNLLAFAISCCALSSGQAIAAPEEIEIYLDDFSEVGKYGLDLHTNYVNSGQSPTEKQVRLTPELSYGINANWEVGGYFLTVTDPGGLPRTDGVKARARWRPGEPSQTSPFYWAINYEIGQVANDISPNASTGEVKLIGVWRNNPWLLGVNLNYDRSIANHPVQSATTEIDIKLGYEIKPGVQIGWENYSSMGAIQPEPGQPQQSNANYLVTDLALGKWDLNIGVGHVTGQSTDNTVLKAIIGVPLY